jgi:hypothetical protein
MADVHVGDYVFGQDGKPSRVTLESETFHKPMYRVTFDDGATVDASEDHVWTVRKPGDKWCDKSTTEVVGLIDQCHEIEVPLCKAVEYGESSLDVEPYEMGVFCATNETKIPDEYLIASVSQRDSLFVGIVGVLGQRKYPNIPTYLNVFASNQALMSQIQELASSLGVSWSLDGGCQGTMTIYTHGDSGKLIASIERIEDVPSKCIAIDNDSHLYLAGRQYTATHNTGVVDPRETWGLIIRGERILHTAQEYQTSRVGFDRLRAKFGNRKNDPDAKFPELNRLVEKYTTSANQMILDLKNGGHIEFRTRGSSGDVGRGGTFDLVVVDEAQSYTEEQDAALSPLNSAAPLGSPQTILMGTVPDPAKPYKGVVFSRLRNFAHTDPYDGLCIHEWGATEVGDPLDEDRWYEFNPSLGYQLLISALRKDARGMSPETFAQEHLGWWGAATLAAHPISASDWAKCKVDTAPDDGRLIYAVKFDPDARMGAIAVCVDDGDGLPHVELAAEMSCRGGVGSFVEWLLGVADCAESIIIDGQSNAKTLENELLDAGVPDEMIARPNTAQAIEAYTGFVNATRAHAVTHVADESTDESVCECNRRRIGTAGGYGFESNDRANATLVDALAFAHWGAMQVRREPAEGMMINL